jgi:hypothetical protein
MINAEADGRLAMEILTKLYRFAGLGVGRNAKRFRHDAAADGGSPSGIHPTIDFDAWSNGSALEAA